MKINYVAIKSLMISLILSSVCCGCDNSVPQRKLKVIQENIVRLGGNSESITEDQLSKYSLPKNLIGKLGVVELSYLDLSGIDLKTVLPHQSLFGAELNGSNLNDKQVSDFSNCNQLRILNISSTNITDSSLKIIAKLPSLETLNLSYCNITDQGMEYLAKSKSLKKISLAETHVTHEGLGKLKKKFPQLSIDIWSKVPSEKIRVALSQFEKMGAYIKAVDSNEKMIKPEFRYRIVLMPKLNPQGPLKFLGGWRHSPKAGNWLMTISESQKISLALYSPTVELMTIFNNVVELPKISQLEIVGHLTYNERRIGEVYFQDNDLALLKKVKISSLILSTTSQITPAGVKNIPKIKGLNELSLNAFPSTQKVFESIASCKEIKKLTLSNTNLAGINFEVLAKAKSLKEIIIADDCKNIDKESLERLLSKRTDIKLNPLKKKVG